MPRTDKIHNAVKNALIKDGWTITDDPFKIKKGRIQLFADLAAERFSAATQQEQLIVVEIKSFTGKSLINELENALGQYALYLGYLEIVAPERKLYLAMSEIVYEKLMELDDLDQVLRRFAVLMIIVDLNREEIVKWES